MIDFMAQFRDATYKKVVVVMGSQMGKTDSVANVFGQRLDDRPVPMMYVGPTKDFIQDVWEPRFNEMVDSAESLTAKKKPGKQEKKTQKEIAGVQVKFAWAGSKSQLRGQPACKVVVDERDAMEDSIGGEGDPVVLADSRHATYIDGQTAVLSTPTLGTIETEYDEVSELHRWKVAEEDDIGSATWKLWQQGTRHEWAWPCPSCQEYFVPRSDLLHWPGRGEQDIVRSADVTGQVRLACPHCGVLIEEASKVQMNAMGAALAPGQQVVDGDIVGETPVGDTYSLWVSGLCSPWMTWESLAKRLLDAGKDPTKLQAVMNTGYGELFSVSHIAPDWEVVANRRGMYETGECPAEVRYITCGVDVQKDRLIYSVRGWGNYLESYGLELAEIYGETEYDSVWALLGQLLSRTWGGLPIHLMFVDSGFRPGDKYKRPNNQIYKFCRQFAGRAFPTKGHDQRDKPLAPSMIDITLDGKTYKKGMQLWHLDSDYFKAWVHARIEWPEEQPGQWFIPSDATEDYCKQIVSEARVVKPNGNGVIWMKIRHDNHWLDCEALNIAAAHRLNLHLQNPDAPTPVPTTPKRRVRSKGVA